jgi:hypothetical protein
MILQLKSDERPPGISPSRRCSFQAATLTESIFANSLPISNSATELVRMPGSLAPHAFGRFIAIIVLRGCLIVAFRTAADRSFGIAKRFLDLMPHRRDQKLFPHFGETGTAVFAIEEVEYDWHDRTSDPAPSPPTYHFSWRLRCEPDHGRRGLKREISSG